MKLQGVYGEMKSKTAGELEIGDICIWNYGYKSVVVGIDCSKTGKSAVYLMKSMEDGIVRERKMLATRLVAVN